MKTLILGGVRSGKSRLAEQLARTSGLPVIYIATACALDEEMRARIAAHRARRPSEWRVIEEPLRLANVLADVADNGRCILVECLTLWLTQLLLSSDRRSLEREREALLSVFPRLSGHVILVGNESNMGIAPLGELTRRYCDEAGLLHQRLALLCDRVALTVAGLPLMVKGEPL